MKFSVICGKYLPELAVGSAIPVVSSASRTSTQTVCASSKPKENPRYVSAIPVSTTPQKRKLGDEPPPPVEKNNAHGQISEVNNNVLEHTAEEPSRKRICNRSDSLGTSTEKNISTDTVTNRLGTLENGCSSPNSSLGTLDGADSPERTPSTTASSDITLGTAAIQASSPRGSVGTLTSTTISTTNSLSTSSSGSSPCGSLGTSTNSTTSSTSSLGTSNETASRVPNKDPNNAPISKGHPDFLNERCNLDLRPSGMLGLLNMSIPVMGIPTQNLPAHPVSHPNLPLYWDSRPSGSLFNPVVYLTEPQLLMMPLSAWPSHELDYTKHAGTGMATYQRTSPETHRYHPMNTHAPMHHQCSQPPTLESVSPNTEPYARRYEELDYHSNQPQIPTQRGSPDDRSNHQQENAKPPSYPETSIASHHKTTQENTLDRTREAPIYGTLTLDNSTSAPANPRLYPPTNHSRFLPPETPRSTDVTPRHSNSPTGCYMDPRVGSSYPVIKQEEHDPTAAYGHLPHAQHSEIHGPTPEQTGTTLNYSSAVCNREKTQTGPYQCRWIHCSSPEFHSKDELINHVNRTHIQAEDTFPSAYICRWIGCGRKGRSFNARYKMLVHVRCHTQEKPHECCQCGKCFSRLENLKIHHRTHTGERPYLCTYAGCSKAFSNSSDRFKHQRTHIVPKPYPCRVLGCLKSYTDPSSLRKHSKTHEPREFSINPTRAANMNIIGASELARLANGLAESRVLDENTAEISRVAETSGMQESRVANEMNLAGVAERSRVAISRVADETVLSRVAETPGMLISRVAMSRVVDDSSPSRVTSITTTDISSRILPNSSPGENSYSATNGHANENKPQQDSMKALIDLQIHQSTDAMSEQRTMNFTKLPDISRRMDDREQQTPSLTKREESQLMSHWITTLTQDKPLDLTTNTI